MATVAAMPAILIDEEGVAWIEGTTTKVIEVALDKRAYGWSPEEMHYQHPHLSLARIHTALAYYHAHQEELDAEIERRHREARKMASEAGPAPLQKRLPASG